MTLDMFTRQVNDLGEENVQLIVLDNNRRISFNLNGASSFKLSEILMPGTSILKVPVGDDGMYNPSLDETTENVFYEYIHVENVQVVTGWLPSWLHEKVSVAGITLNQTMLDLPEKTQYQLVATIKPDNATNKRIIWTTSDKQIATVDENGLVTGIRDGRVVITAKSEDSNFTATALLKYVHIPVKVTGVELDRETLTGFVGDQFKLNARIKPEDAENKNVTWKSSDKNIATVSHIGVVKFIKKGEVDISVTTEDGDFTDSTDVTVNNINVTGVVLDTEELEVNVGETRYLYARVFPTDATVKDVVWSSTNPAVATVDDTGLVTPLTIGETDIIVTTVDGGFVDTCSVVTQDPNYVAVTGIRLDKESTRVYIGKTTRLVATILPTYASVKGVVWTSSNEEIATVDSQGTITGISEGTVTITATSVDGGFSDTCSVSSQIEIIRVSGVTLSPSSISAIIGDAYKLTVGIIPSNANNKNIRWEYNSDVVDFDEVEKTFVMKRVGLTIISAITEDGNYKASCSVTGRTQSVTGITMDQKIIEVDMGLSVALSATIAPANASNKTILWSTSNPAIATVNSTGLVSGVSLGDVTITATTQDGGFKDTAQVTVALGIPFNVSGSMSDGSSFDETFETQEEVTNWLDENRDTIKELTVEGVFDGDISGLLGNMGNLTDLDVSGMNTDNVTNMDNTFAGNTNLPSLDVGDLNFSKVESMDGTFSGNDSLTNLELGDIDTSNVTNMDNAFSGNTNLPSLDVSGLDTGKVESMNGTFSGNDSLTDLNVDGLNTENVTNMDNIFSGNTNLPELDLRDWDFDKVETSTGMLDGTPNLNDVLVKDEADKGFIENNIPEGETITVETSIAVKSIEILNTAPSVDISDTLVVTYKILPEDATTQTVTFSTTNPDIATIDTEGNVTFTDSGYVGLVVTTTDRGLKAFYDVEVISRVESIEITNNAPTVGVGRTYQLETIILPETASNKNVIYTSSDETVATIDEFGLIEIVGRGNVTFTATTIDGEFSDTYSTEAIVEYRASGILYGSGSFDTSFDTQAAITSYIRSNTSNFVNLKISGEFSGSISGLFSSVGRTNGELDLRFFMTEEVTDMENLFNGIRMSTIIGLENMNTSNVTDMKNMFYSTTNITSLNISNLDTSKVTNMSGMFYNSSIKKLDFSNFDTSNVTDMSLMFSYYKGEELDLRSFNTSKVTTMSSMFLANEDNSILKVIKTSSFTCESLTVTSNMFRDLLVLERIDLSGFDTTGRPSNMTSGAFMNCPNVKVSIGRTEKDCVYLNKSQSKPANINFIPPANAESVEILGAPIKIFEGEEYRLFADVLPLNVINQDVIWSSSNPDVIDIDEYGNLKINSVGLSTITATSVDGSFTDSVIIESSEVIPFRIYGTDINDEDFEIVGINQNDFNNKIIAFGRSNIKTAIVEGVFKGSMASYFSFENCVNLDISSIDTYFVTHMNRLFENIKVSTLDISSLNTVNVINLERMFYNNINLISIDVSNLRTANVISFYIMFGGCHSLTKVDISNFVINDDANLQGLFSSCISLVDFKLPEIHNKYRDGMSYMFTNCPSLTKLDLRQIKSAYFYNVTNINVFSGCSSVISSFANDSGMATTFNRTQSKPANVVFVVPEDVQPTSIEITNTEPFIQSVINGQLKISLEPKSTIYNTITYLSLTPDIATIDTEGKITVLKEGRAKFKATTENELYDEFEVDTLIHIPYRVYGIKEVDGELTEFDDLYDTESEVRAAFNNTTYNYLQNIKELTFDGIFYTENPYTLFNRNSYSTIKTDKLIFGDVNMAYISSLNLSFVREFKEIYMENISFDRVVTVTKMLSWTTSSEINPMLKFSLKGSSFPILENANQMFWDTNVIDLDLTDVDMPNVKTMDEFCYNNGIIESLDISSINTSNVTNMESMFSGLSKLRAINLSNFNTEKVTTMESMFYNNTSIESIDVSTFNTSNVTNTANMFRNCVSLKSLNLTSFDVSKIPDPDGSQHQSSSYMFNGCNNIENALANDQVTCDKLNAIHFSSPNVYFTIPSELMGVEILDTIGTMWVGKEYQIYHRLIPENVIDSSVTYTSSNPSIASVSDNGVVTAIGVGDVIITIRTNDGGYTSTKAFSIKEPIPFSIRGENLDGSPILYNPENQTVFKSNINSIKSTAKSLTVSGIFEGDATSLFYGMPNLESIDISNLDTYFVTKGTSMFYNIPKLTSLDLNNFYTTNMTDMSNMFRVLKSIKEINAEKLVLINTTTTNSMFYECQKLQAVSFNDYKTFNLIDMGSMFRSCIELTYVDISKLYTNKVGNLDSIFQSCNNIRVLDLGELPFSSISNIASAEAAFANCTNTSISIAENNTIAGIFNNTKYKPSNITFKIARDVPIESLEITGTQLGIIEGDDLVLKYKILPSDTINYQTKYSTSDANIATINDSGVISGVSPGIVTITVSSMDDSISDSVDIEIIEKIPYRVYGTTISNEEFDETFVTEYDTYLGLNQMGKTNIKTLTLNGVFIDHLNNSLSGMTNLENIIFENVNTKYVLSITNLLSSSTKLKSINLSGMDFSSITTLSSFAPETSIESVDLSNTVFTNLNSINSTFSRMNKLKNVNFTGIITPNLTNMSNIFYENDGIVNVDLSPIQVNKVTITQNLFYGCNALESVNINGWTIESPINMYRMFYGCNKLTSLDFSTIDTSFITNLIGTFQSTTSVTEAYAKTQEDADKLNTSSGKPTTWSFVVDTPVTGVEITNTETQMDTSSTLQLAWNVLPEGANNKNVTFSSDNTAIATVDENGLITSTETTGAVTITVTTEDGGFTDSITLDVIKIEWPYTFNGTYTDDSIIDERFATESEARNYLNTTNKNLFKTLIVDGEYNGSVQIGTRVYDTLFSNMINLLSLDVSNLDTSSVTDMGYMFYECSNLTSLDVSNFDTNSVINMGHMFRNCFSLTSLDLSSFNTDNVDISNSGMSWMFAECTSVQESYARTQIDADRFNATSPKPANVNFVVKTPVTGVEITNTETQMDTSSTLQLTWNVLPEGAINKNVTFSSDDITIATVDDNGLITSTETAGTVTITITTEDGGFTDSITLDVGTTPVREAYFEYYLSANPTVKVKTSFNSTSEMRSFFSSEKARFVGELVAVRSKGFDVFTDMSYMFRDCFYITSLDLSGFDTSGVTTMNNMFSNCSRITSINLSNFDTGSVTDMSSMFYDCYSLTSVDLSSFDTNSVTEMGAMFYDCSSLTSVDLSNFDTSSNTSLGSMFNGCSSLTSVNLSSFDTSSVTSMSSMFQECSKLTSLDLSSFDTTNITSTSSTFYRCSSVTEAFARTQADADKLNSSYNKHYSVNFVVKS